MRIVRTIHDDEILSLKGATEACYLLGGGVTSFAELTRVGVSTLVKYGSVSRNSEGEIEFYDKMIGIDVAVEADRRARTPIIIKEAARLLGYQLAPLQALMAQPSKVSERDAHVVLAEAMDVSRLLMSAFEDGKIDALERKQLRKELRELIRCAEQILDRLEE